MKDRRKHVKRISNGFIAGILCVSLIFSWSFRSIKASENSCYTMTEIWNEGDYVDYIPTNSTVTISSKQEFLYFLDFLRAKGITDLLTGIIFVQTEDIKFSDYEYRYDEDRNMYGAYQDGKLVFAIDTTSRFYGDFSKNDELSEQDERIRNVIVSSSTQAIFRGIYDGQNHALEGMLVKDHAIFQQIGKEARVQNLKIENSLGVSSFGLWLAAVNYGIMENCVISACVGMNAGDVTLANQNSGTISNCKSIGLKSNITQMKTLANKGLIANNSSGVVENCEADIELNARKIDAYNDSSDFGGIVGACKGGYISDCSAKIKGFIEEDCSIENMGGIVGSVVGTDLKISNCQARIEIQNKGKIAHFGGICGTAKRISGDSKKEISNCKSTGFLVGTGEISGGILGQDIVGKNPKTPKIEVKDCFSDINFMIESDGNYKIGGIVANAVTETIINCGYRGIIQTKNQEINTRDDIVGGIVGYIEDCCEDELKKEYFNIENCYYLNDITNFCSEGYIGKNEHFGMVLTIENCCDSENMLSEEKMFALNQWVDKNNSEHLYREWKKGRDNFLSLGIEFEQEDEPVPEDSTPLPTLVPTPMPSEEVTNEPAKVSTPTPQVTEKPIEVTPEPNGVNPEPSKPLTENNADGKKEEQKKKSTLMKVPVVKISKGKLRGVSYLQIYLKKYEGTDVEIYMAVAKKFTKVHLKSSKISKYKGKFRLTYKARGKKISCKVRTWKKKNGKKIYSGFTKVFKVKL